ncbi:hypothetical protein AVEN_6834-1 [Araneus ventricosus]|uniref:Uncharacterized protein n=1 Tax=Araneus ventricosus TaxID=182803 RepID=A0A4Y2R268_ARAVE|nr:hypothetical protein AVEN_6834-1 [Araneus ventricosus]
MSAVTRHGEEKSGVFTPFPFLKARPQRFNFLTQCPFRSDLEHDAVVAILFRIAKGDNQAFELERRTEQKELVGVLGKKVVVVEGGRVDFKSSGRQTGWHIGSRHNVMVDISSFKLAVNVKKTV